MDAASRAQWALNIALSRDDLGHTDWNQAAAILAAACALPGAKGLEARALEQAMELAAERFSRAPKRAALPSVSGEEDASFEDLIGFTAASLRHGGLATSYVAFTLRACEIADHQLTQQERTRLTRVVRSVLVVREVDRYLGGKREAQPGLPRDLWESQQLLEAQAVEQLEHIAPDQVFKGVRVAFVGELIHGVIHAYAVRQVLRLVPQAARMPQTRLAEQVSAQQHLIDLNPPLQFDDLNTPSSLDYLEVLGQGFDDPEKLQFACCARELFDAHDRPEAWEAHIARTLAALE